MVKQFSVSKFKEWEDAHSENPNLPCVTKSALIKLSELETFLNTVKNLGDADSVRISFLRFKMDDDSINIPQEKKHWSNERIPVGCKWIEAGEGLTQVAIAIIPTKNHTLDEELIERADNIIGENDSKILVLMPGGEDVGPTGHNPPPTAKGDAPKGGN